MCEKALPERRLPHVLTYLGAVGRDWMPSETSYSLIDAAYTLALLRIKSVPRCRA